MSEYMGNKVRIRENKDNDQCGYSNLLGKITRTVFDYPTEHTIKYMTGATKQN